jgi:hypothetical protein
MPTNSPAVAVTAALDGNRGRGCKAGSVAAYPFPVAPSQVQLDVPFTMNGTLRGGDYLALGQPGVPVKKHEIIAANPATGSGVGGEVLASWSVAVVTSKKFSRTVTLTTAQHTSLGLGASVHLWLRSYSCDESGYKEDVAVSSVIP